MRSLRDLLIFILCGTGLVLWGTITALSPGASEITDAGSPYWTIPLGVAMVAAGIALEARSRRRRRTPAQAADPVAGPRVPPERPADGGTRGPEGTGPPGP